MATLYDGKMAAIYDAMYQTFIDYDEEFDFYNKLIQENNCKTLLEIGSGTGNLAKRFEKTNLEYTGLDYSISMINIAKKRNKTSNFIHGDMREFQLKDPVDSIIITGRSSSYLISNEDVNECFNAVYDNLSNDGVFLFDFIDANRFIPFIIENQVITHQAQHEEINYVRESRWETTTSDNFMLEWTAQYYILNNEEKKTVAEDFSTVRVFTLNEMQLLLFLNGFEIIKTIDRKTYAFDTYVIVAKKKPQKQKTL